MRKQTGIQAEENRETNCIKNDKENHEINLLGSNVSLCSRRSLQMKGYARSRTPLIARYRLEGNTSFKKGSMSSRRPFARLSFTMSFSLIRNSTSGSPISFLIKIKILITLIALIRHTIQTSKMLLSVANPIYTYSVHGPNCILLLSRYLFYEETTGLVQRRRKGGVTTAKSINTQL